MHLNLKDINFIFTLVLKETTIDLLCDRMYEQTQFCSSSKNKNMAAALTAAAFLPILVVIYW